MGAGIFYGAAVQRFQSYDSCFRLKVGVGLLSNENSQERMREKKFRIGEILLTNGVIRQELKN